jgi:hypothetical protein
VVRRGNEYLDLPEDQAPEEARAELGRSLRAGYRILFEHAGEEGKKLIEMMDRQDQREQEFKEYQARMEVRKREWEESDRKTEAFWKLIEEMDRERWWRDLKASEG